MHPSVLSVQRLTKRFGGLMAVDHVSFEIEKGEIIGIIGPNGAGKTTLFNLITGNIPADEGEVHFKERSITREKPHNIASLGIGRTFQVVKPFGDLTVEQNVMMGTLPKHASFARAQQAAGEVLELLKLTRYRHEPAHSLPIGLKKKLELARAFALGPSLLFLDEVMGGLNPREVQEMMDLITLLNKKHGITICMIEHVMAAVVALCERIVVLQQGRKLMEGTPQEITSNEAVIEAYLGGDFAHA